MVAGHVHTCALLADGRVQCWGGNEYAQLGVDEWRGHFNGALGRPTDVGDGEAPWSAFGGIIGPESPPLAGLRSLTMGVAHGCARALPARAGR